MRVFLPVSVIFYSLVFLFFSGAELQAQGFYDPNIDLAVGKVVLEPNGKIFIAGGFRNVGGQPRSRVSRLNADGTLDLTFPDPQIAASDPNNNQVFAIARQSDGKILVGGLFNSVLGQARNYLARLNNDGSLDTTFNSDINGALTALAIQSDGRIIIGGEFTFVGGIPLRGLARLNADGSVDASFQNVNLSDPPDTIAIDPDGKVLIGGFFTSIAGQPRQFAARLNSNGTLDTSFNFIVNAEVRQFTFLPDGKMYVCGFFSTINGSPRKVMARITSNGAIDTSFGDVNVPSGNITSFDLQSDGKIMVAGDFSQIGGQERNDVARIGPDGAIDTSFADPNANFGGNFSSIGTLLVQPDGNILIGGSFSMIGGQTRRNAVRLTPDGRLDLPPAQTLIVNKIADTDDGICNADCSLREAVTAANAITEATAIRFDPAVFSTPQTITLVFGELAIADNHRVSIIGPGAALLTISGNNTSRILRFQRDADVAVSGVTMSNGNGVGPEPGNGSGGAIYVGTGGVRTRLVVKDSVITGNRGTNSGAISITGSFSSASIESSIVSANEAQVVGAISRNNGTLTINNSTISNNRSTNTIPGSGVGGIDVSGPSATLVISGSSVSGNTGSLGGLRSTGTAMISTTAITNNTGGGISSSGTMTLLDSTINQNTVSGGIQNLGRLYVVNSQVSNNTGNFGGGISGSGGIDVSGSVIADNSATSGAGIYNNTGSGGFPVNITNSVLSNNIATSFGGGIYNRDLVNITNSTISNNRSGTNGGGIFNVMLNAIGAGTTNVVGSTFTGNFSSAAGAAISNQDGTIALNNSTVSGNTANGLGGAVSNLRGTINIFNATVASNVTGSATNGAVNNSAGSINVMSSILADNVAGGQAIGSEIAGTITSVGYNLVENRPNGTFGGAATDILGQDPRLGPLANNGGSTQTRTLLSGSPALDKGSNSGFGFAFDQRGVTFTRSVDLASVPNAADGTDIGAYEVQIVGGFEGDVAPRMNGDGQLISSDVVQLRRFVTGLDVPSTSSNEFQRSDIAPSSTLGDGVLTSADVVQARRYASGLDPLVGTGGPSQPTSPTPSIFQDKSQKSAPFDRSLKIGPVNGSKKGTVAFAVKLDTLDSGSAVSFTLEYDAARLSHPVVTLAGDRLPQMAVLTVNAREPGRIRILVDSDVQLIENSKDRGIVEIEFEASETATDESPLFRFSEVFFAGESMVGNDLWPLKLSGR